MFLILYDLKCYVFFDKNQLNQKVLKRFNIQFDTNLELSAENVHNQNKFLAKEFILIDTPLQCYSLQENIT